MKSATLQLETLTCPSCLLKVESALKSVDGVKEDSVKVMFNASKAKFEYDESKTDLETAKKAVEKVGYEVLKATEK